MTSSSRRTGRKRRRNGAGEAQCGLHEPSAVDSAARDGALESAERGQDPQASPEAILASMHAAMPFGPSFFVGQLGAYVRDRCPDPTDALPFVHLHLASGDILDLCHVIGLAPRWIALAVYEGAATVASRTMRTELVPYESIVRVTIRSGQAEGTHIGFSQESPPSFPSSPERALEMAGTLPGKNGSEPEALVTKRRANVTKP